MQRSNRGGVRPGAGRKPDGESAKVVRSVRLPAEVDEYLSTLQNASKTICDAISKSANFRAWKARKNSSEKS